jgi:hypothetical protein
VPYKIKSVHLLVIKVIITKMHGATHIKKYRDYLDLVVQNKMLGTAASWIGLEKYEIREYKKML